jgi:ribosome-binding factor A
MTNRLARVRELMKHELAAILQRDFEFGGALVTINDVDLTPDLKQAHIYLGMVGREDLQQDALENLRRHRKAISTKLSKRVILKNTPQLYFKLDDSVERGVRVLNILQQIDAQLPPDAEPLEDDQPDAR